jgi:hypothetical protein
MHSGTLDQSIRSYNFFLDTTIAGAGTYATNYYPYIDQNDGVPFLSHSIMLIIDGAADIYFSFDGVTDHGRVKPNQPISQDYRRNKAVWFRGTAGTAFRFWAW